MSHVTEVKTAIKDLDALEEAVGVLGGELIRNKKSFAWYGRFMNDSDEGRRVVAERGVTNLGKCEHVIRVKDAPKGDYEIGVLPALDGDGYALQFDTFGTGQKLVHQFGTGMQRIRQEYAASVATGRATATLARKGWKLSRESMADGSLKLKLRKR